MQNNESTDVYKNGLAPFISQVCGASIPIKGIRRVQQSILFYFKSNKYWSRNR